MKYQFSLNEIEVSQIEPNPDNPRGPRVRDNDDQFDDLKRSIRQFKGIIVPLIVQEIIKGEKYRLIDGERRYLVLKELGIKRAPAHIIRNKIDKGKMKNIMFHIHTNWSKWDAYQQCKSLEPIYEQLKNRLKKDENKIALELVKRTGTNRRTINDRLSFLRWPKNIKDIVYNEKPDLYWTIAEIEGGIIKPAEKNFPEYFKKVSKDKVREFLLKKYIEGSVRVSTEVRKVKYIVRTTKEHKKQHAGALKIFEKLVKNIDYTFEEAQEEFLAKFPEAEKMMKTSYAKLRNQLLKVTTMMEDFDISLWFKSLTRIKKEDMKEILQNLERVFEDFKQNF